MLETNDLRKMSIEELQNEINQSQRSLYIVSLDVQAKQEKRTNLVGDTKHYIARLKTILREKTLISEMKANLKELEELDNN